MSCRQILLTIQKLKISLHTMQCVTSLLRYVCLVLGISEQRKDWGKTLKEQDQKAVLILQTNPASKMLSSFLVQSGPRIFSCGRPAAAKAMVVCLIKAEWCISCVSLLTFLR